jgi:hypothetical protein
MIATKTIDELSERLIAAKGRHKEQDAAVNTVQRAREATDKADPLDLAKASRQEAAETVRRCEADLAEARSVEAREAEAKRIEAGRQQALRVDAAVEVARAELGKLAELGIGGTAGLEIAMLRPSRGVGGGIDDTKLRQGVTAYLGLAAPDQVAMQTLALQQKMQALGMKSLIETAENMARAEKQRQPQETAGYHGFKLMGGAGE